MNVTQAYRYELKPNNKQRGLLMRHCGVARFAWNWGLARRKALFRENDGKDKFTTAITQHRELNALKKSDFPWMYEVSKVAPQQALRNLDTAFKNFWRGRKTTRRTGFPKFKKKGKHDSFGISGAIHIFENGIQLPRLGKIRTKENTGKFDGRILSATVSREADRWFVSLGVERERAIPQTEHSGVVGIDLGLNSFAVTYDGNGFEHIYSPKPLKAKLKKLKRLSRCHSRKKNGSNNKRKASLRLARLHRHIKNTRMAFLHKQSTSLAKTKSAIVIEDLNVSGMVRNRCLARSIADSGWGEFRRMLEYKAPWYGSQLVVIGRFAPTSKVCSECGVVNDKLTLSDRKWVCLACGAIHERDENAAKVIRQIGLEMLNTVSFSTGINACGVGVSPCHTVGSRRRSRKQVHPLQATAVIDDKTC